VALLALLLEDGRDVLRKRDWRWRLGAHGRDWKKAKQ
jgi:hypothetical protein